MTFAIVGAAIAVGMAASVLLFMFGVFLPLGATLDYHAFPKDDLSLNRFLGKRLLVKCFYIRDWKRRR